MSHGFEDDFAVVLFAQGEQSFYIGIEFWQYNESIVSLSHDEAAIRDLLHFSVDQILTIVVKTPVLILIPGVHFDIDPLHLRKYTIFGQGEGLLCFFWKGLQKAFWLE